MPAVSERYAQWVLEDRFSAGRPDLAAAGVELRNDVGAYEAMKGRMLNASHMLLAYPAILCGYRLVHEAMDDLLLRRLLTQFMERDVISSLTAPGGVSLHAYKKSVLERFSNPAVADQLLRVAGDGAAKLPVFHSKTIAALVGKGGDVRRAAFLLACFRSYLDGVDEHGAAFDVIEPHLTEADWALLRGDDPLAALKISPFSRLSLAKDASFARAFLTLTTSNDKVGTQATPRTLVHTLQDIRIIDGRHHKSKVSL